MRRAVVMVATLALLFQAAPQPTLGYNPSGKTWWINSAYYCNVNMTSQQYAVAEAGLLAWNPYSQFKFVEGGGFFPCTVWLRIGQTTDNTPAQTSVSIDATNHIREATVTFDTDAVSHFYWSTSVQNCNVHGTGSPCKMDAYSVAMHEAGHVLGFSHNGGSGGFCHVHGPDVGDPAFYSTSFLSSCDSLGERIMFAYAGAELLNCSHCPGSRPHQGFRRHIDANHRDGVADLYGAP